MSEGHEVGSMFVSHLLDRAEARAHERALVFMPDGETVAATWTFADLLHRAAGVAAALRERDLAGCAVLLVHPPGVEYIASLLGVLWSGAVAVPAYPPRRRSMDRFDAIVRSCGARIALTEGGAPLGGVESLDTRTIAGVDPSHAPPVEARPDDLAVLQYTSGSTGTPKGVRITHRNLIANQRAMGEVLVAPPGTVSVSWLPPYHDMGLMGSILGALFRGYTNVFMPPLAFMERPLRWLRAIDRFRGALTAAPDFAYRLCAETATEEDVTRLDLSSWTLALDGAEPVRATTLERFCEVFEPAGFSRGVLSPCYGLAESTLYVTGVPPGRVPTMLSVDPRALEVGRLCVADGEQRRLVGCGQPAPQHDVAIVDESGRPCRDGVVGEIWIAGPSLADGYLGEAADAPFLSRLDGRSEGYFRTGDLGALYEGELFVVGRLGERVIIDGRNHYPTDIEASVIDVDRAFVAGGSALFSVDDGERERVVLVQEARRTHGDRETLRRAIRRARRAVSERHGLALDEVLLVRAMTLPRTSSGKIQRRVVKQSFEQGRLKPVVSDRRAEPASQDVAEVSPVVAQVDLQKKIQALVARFVGRRADAVELDMPVAEYGLSSLDGVRLSSQLSDLVGRRVPVTAWLDHPTVARMAAHLRQRPGAQNLAESPASAFDRIAVVGVGLRLPGGIDSLDELARALAAGRDLVSDRRPQGRPDAGQAGAGSYVEAPDAFDAELFDVLPVEAAQMDPQQRLLLEVTRDALEDAAVPPATLAGRPVGVFVGISNVDYARRGAPVPYAGTGNAMSIAANRLSYHFDFHGPSLAIDTACSSSLVAVHQACQSIFAGDSELAVAAGVNLILDDTPTRALAASGFLSPRNRCRAFDAGADGYVRGEGCIAVLLCPLAVAEARGYPVHGIIRGSAVNQDGRSNGLTAPHGPSQRTVIARAWARADVAPRDIDYIEAHGTGTRLGDPIEFNTLAELVGEASSSGPCWVGSVKTNFGHLEAAAGLAGLLKALLSVRDGVIYPHLHLDNPNPALRKDTRLAIAPRQALSWSNSRRVAAVSAFGFGGTNAHAVVEQAPAARPTTVDAAPVLTVVSAKRERDLAPLAAAHRRHLEDHPELSVDDWCRTMAFGREALQARAAWPTQDRRDLLERLARLAAGEADAVVQRGVVPRGEQGRLLFMFSGQGGSYPGMGRSLLERFEVAASVVAACDDVLMAQGAEPTRRLLVDGDASGLTDPARAQPALFVLQCALVEVWSSLGVRPVAVIGHSLGEYAAATVAGVVSREAALSIVLARGRLIAEHAGEGAMVAIVGTKAEVEAVRTYAQLDLAADNGHREFVLAGPTSAVEAAVGEALERGLLAKRLDVTEGFHSAAMDPVVSHFAPVVERIEFAPPRVPVFATGGDGPEGERMATDEYWLRQIRSPVRWAPALKRAVETVEPCGLVELGPSNVLCGLASAYGDRRAVVATIARETAADQHLSAARARLFVAGIDLEPGDRAPVGPRLAGLPKHPRVLQSFWHVHAGDPAATPNDWQAETRVSCDLQPSLRDHVLLEQMIVAASSHTAMLLATLASGRTPAALAGAAPTPQLILQDLAFPQALLLQGETAQALTTWMARTSDGWQVRVTSVSVDAEPKALTHLTGAIRRDESAPSALPNLEQRHRMTHMTGEAVYARTRARGMHLGPAFAWIRNAWVDGDEAIGELVLPDGAAVEPGHPLPAGLLDSAFQLAASTAAAVAAANDLFVVVRIARLTLHRPVSPHERVWVQCRLRPGDRPELHTLSVIAVAEGAPVFAAEGVEIHRATVRGFLRGLDPDQVDGILYTTAWRPRPSAAPLGGGVWLRWSTRVATGDALGRANHVQGAQVQDVDPTAIEAWLRRDEVVGLIVDLRPSSSFATPTDAADEIEQAQRTGALAVLRALQIALRVRPSLPIRVLTQGALLDVPGSAATSTAPVDAPVRGLMRAAYAEGVTFVRLIDGDQTVAGASWDAEIVADGYETEVALRGSDAFVSRLVRVEADDAPSPPAIDPGAAYIITGGLGALGLHMAEWYAERGARRLVLVGRRAPTPGAAERLRALRSRGVEVMTERADVADSRVWDALFQRAKPVRGVVHAAGVLDDAPLSAQTEASYLATFRPKALGAWNVRQRADVAGTVDHVVLFSSVASVVGSPGQANYAAANAFLDALAHVSGTATYSIAWGPWAGEGMAASVDPSRFSASGVTPLRPSAARLGVDAALAQGARQVAAIVADWNRLVQVSERPPALFRELADEPTTGARPSPALLRDLAAATPEDAGQRLQQLIVDELHEATGLPTGAMATDEPMTSLGLDSLIVVRLQGRLEGSLGVKVPMTRFMEGVTINGLAEDLYNALLDPALSVADAPALPQDEDLSHAPDAETVYSKEEPPPLRSGRTASTVALAASAPAPLSLFYFSRAEGGDDAYRLLLDGARLADAQGMAAVWLPERHFHEFGGLYPNPSVLAAALATITHHVRLRSGSVVLPLHHPARVVEEWAVVDRLSRGRVDLSFVRGWGPNDFALAPEAFERRTDLLYEKLDLVRRLWRGEAVTMTNGRGEPADLRVFPRPYQPELPVWLTCTKDPLRFEEAGRVGANVLTALLLQTPQELGPKIELYRRARREAGHDGPGHVTLMMHTFVASDAAEVRTVVRAPLLQYLRSSVDLWRGGSERLQVDDEERERMLSFAFERYYSTSGLFGTPKHVRRRAQRLLSMGVDELACLVDFGVDDDVTLNSLPLLGALAEDLRGGER